MAKIMAVEAQYWESASQILPRSTMLRPIPPRSSGT
jgi:hypothetical protein